MSTTQYLRKASLIVGDDQEAIDLSELRFRFVVRRGDISTPNTAEIRVYNVAPNTAQKLQKEFARVVLQAGYDGNYGLLFDGTVRQIIRGRENQTDTYVDIRAASGDKAYNYAFANLTLAAGTTPQERLEALVAVMEEKGVKLGYVPPNLPKERLPRGKVLFGLTRGPLKFLMSTIQGKWAIQDRSVDVIPLNSYIPEEPVEINSATGLVGMPEQTIGGLNLRCLLNPKIKIGRRIKLNNASIQAYRLGLSRGDLPENDRALIGGAKYDSDGIYYVMMANHYGDTRGQEWYSDLTCLAVDATWVSDQYTSIMSPLGDGPIKP